MLNGDEATKESTKKEIDITMGVKGAPNGLFMTVPGAMERVWS